MVKPSLENNLKVNTSSKVVVSGIAIVMTLAMNSSIILLVYSTNNIKTLAVEYAK